ncbi:FMN-dependent NADH-azoreductase [Micavibrio aeruginosavorus]|uniref:FMN dependent NADH:quinone oxidoreductase n=1 Tax=Micavibrio aeruginosavorus EPB TaxID=349215 RepID=M4VD34_9BACT|nr:FMN-dependent NADH-azoreductase [Micavibrio aeruginosavorus]AGH97128.1 FMN-dependent NADH-azoreductase [Micavibrio aeruginosavorus EPB]
MKILHIDSSIMGDNSVSRQLSKTIVERIEADHDEFETTYLDLARDPVQHLSGELFAAQASAPEHRTADQQRDIDHGAKIMNDFLAADIIVIGAPMYNFSVPSQLKAWIDRVAVAGKTFRYTEKGPEGLAGGKKVVIVSSRGGFYGPDTPAAPMDHQEPYLRAVFGFLGITDIEYVRAEGIAMGPDHRQSALDNAMSTIASQCDKAKANRQAVAS